MIKLLTAHPNPKVVGAIDPMLWMFEVDDYETMDYIASRLHHIYSYILNSKVNGQPMFKEHVVKQVCEILHNDAGRSIALGDITEPEP